MSPGPGPEPEPQSDPEPDTDELAFVAREPDTAVDHRPLPPPPPRRVPHDPSAAVVSGPEPEADRIRVGSDAHDSPPGNPFGPVLASALAAGVALAGLIVAAIEGAAYLSFTTLNAGMIIFVAGSISLLLAAPFVIQRTVFASIRESERRWERALVSWGGIALMTMVFGVLLGSAGGFDGDSLAGAVGMVLIAESAIVLVAVATMMLEG